MLLRTDWTVCRKCDIIELVKTNLEREHCACLFFKILVNLKDWRKIMAHDEFYHRRQPKTLFTEKVSHSLKRAVALWVIYPVIPNHINNAIPIIRKTIPTCLKGFASYCLNS